jgi:hypothetical protein
MIKDLGNGFYQGEYLMYQSLGKKGKTYRYAVHNRKDGALIGYIKWFNHWRQHCFYPLNCVVNYTCLIEIASVVKMVNDTHKAGWKKRKTKFNKTYTKRDETYWKRNGNGQMRLELRRSSTVEQEPVNLPVEGSTPSASANLEDNG